MTMIPPVIKHIPPNIKKNSSKISLNLSKSTQIPTSIRNVTKMNDMAALTLANWGSKSGFLPIFLCVP